MASAPADNANVASGVNNAIARTAGLAAVTIIPTVTGLSQASGSVALTSSFRLSLPIAAGPTPSRSCCAVDGPPCSPEHGFLAR